MTTNISLKALEGNVSYYTNVLKNLQFALDGDLARLHGFCFHNKLFMKDVKRNMEKDKDLLEVLCLSHDNFTVADDDSADAKDLVIELIETLAKLFIQIGNCLVCLE